jgi:hypothetical protein
VISEALTDSLFIPYEFYVCLFTSSNKHDLTVNKDFNVYFVYFVLNIVLIIQLIQNE